MSALLIVVEHTNGTVKKYSLELASKAAELAAKCSLELIALSFGTGAENTKAELEQYGVKKIFAASSFNTFNSEQYSAALVQLMQEQSATCVLGSASPFGKDVLGRAAMKANVALATDCIAIDCDGGKLKAKRPIFAGKAIVDVSLESKVQMATLRPNTFPLQAQAATAEVVEFTPAAVASRSELLNVEESEAGVMDLTEADKIISAGRSIGNADNFKMIYDCAKALHASVGASRAAVDAGYIGHDHQVGQTGKTVNPSLYIACGISGAIQHLAGMRTSKIVVAINKDADAPIFQHADYGIVADMFEVVPELTKAFHELISE